MTRPDYCPVAQEPCQAMCAMSDVRCKIRDTHPPKREWQGLTDEEVEAYEDWADFQVGCGRQTMFDMIKDIEAKLRERNT